MKPPGAVKLTVIPLTWHMAREFNDTNHRHYKSSRAGRWAIGVIDETGMVRGVALCSRPVSRIFDDGLTIEVNRTATDGCPNANSALYGACWRIASAMGYRRIVTYNREDESGVSLKASGFVRVRTLPARGSWSDHSIKLRHIRHPYGDGHVVRTLWEKIA